MGPDTSLNKLESPSPKYALCQILIGLGKLNTKAIYTHTICKYLSAPLGINNSWKLYTVAKENNVESFKFMHMGANFSGVPDFHKLAGTLFHGFTPRNNK